jgi:GAF domain-containing protein
MDEVLRSTVRMARLCFGAHAASVFLHDAATDMLVLRCSSEDSFDKVLDVRIASDQGIAGWVFQSGQPTLQSDPLSNPNFDRDAAESTGYIPKVIVAVPIEYGTGRLGVLEVLDPTISALGDRDQIEVAQEVANHLAASITGLANEAHPRRFSADECLDRLHEGLRLLAKAASPASIEILQAVECLVSSAITQDSVTQQAWPEGSSVS